MSIFAALVTPDGGVTPSGDRVAGALRQWSAGEVRTATFPGAALGCHPIAADTWRRRDQQPSGDEGRRVAIVADCRLDNRDQLHRTLSLDTTLPDSALLLNAYARWGSGMVSHVVGDFAIVVWDWRQRKLTVFRDHLGVKPVYYWVGEREVAVASDVSILVDLVDLPLIPDDHFVVEHLLMQYRSTDRTFLSKIKRLPGGHSMVADSRGVAVQRYWYPPSEEIRSTSTEQVHRDLRDLFSRSVERRLDSDGPLMAHLSGGLDSSSIVCVADQIYRSGGARPALKVISALYPGLDCDESPFIGSVVGQIAFEAETWDGRADGIFPLYSPSIIGPGMGAEKAGDMRICVDAGAKVLLSGLGGDHVGASYGVSEDRASERSVRDILKGICGPNVAFSRRVTRLRGLARRLAPMSVRRVVGNARGRWLAPSWLAEEWRGLAGNLAAAGYAVDATMSHVKQRHWEEVTTASLGLALDSDQHRAASAGVEIRYPFLDLALVQYVLCLPARHWPTAKSYGRLQREFLGATLPVAVRTRSKAVFSTGAAHRMKSAWPRLRSLFFDGEWRSEKYVNRQSAQLLMHKGEKNSDGADWPLWRAIWGIGTLEAWLRAISGYVTPDRRI